MLCLNKNVIKPIPLRTSTNKSWPSIFCCCWNKADNELYDVFNNIRSNFVNRYDYEASHRACFLGWTSSLSYSAVLLVITFCFPLVSMLVFYYAILQVARTKCKRINFGECSRVYIRIDDLNPFFVFILSHYASPVWLMMIINSILCVYIGTMSEPPMTPLERIQTLAATGNPPPTPPGCAELANMLGDLGRVAMSDSQTSIGNSNNNNRSLRRNRFSFNGRKPSFSWLSSTSSINSTAPVKGDSCLYIYRMIVHIYFDDDISPIYFCVNISHIFWLWFIKWGRRRLCFLYPLT